MVLIDIIPEEFALRYMFFVVNVPFIFIVSTSNSEL